MARLLLDPGQTFGSIGGQSITDVVGSNANETVILAAEGKAVFDPSFARGGDVITIQGNAALYTASLNGSRLVLTAANGASISIPVGTVGAEIRFADAARTLLLDGGSVHLGDQTIAGAPVAVIAGETPPIDNPPIDNPPADDPPADNPPVVDPPVIDPPVVDPPVVDPPVIDPPVIDPPADDTVVVADADVLNNNASSDENDGTPPTKIQIANFVDYDTFDGKGQRVPFSQQTPAQIQDVINQNQRSYNLGGKTDTVDYSAELGTIISVVNFAQGAEQRIIVDGNRQLGGIDGLWTDTESRVDRLSNIERVVAAGGPAAESIIDLTNFGKDVALRYQTVAQGQAVAATIADEDTVAVNLLLTDLTSGLPFQSFSYVEYYDSNDGDAKVGETAFWTRVEGSDSNEYIELTADQIATVNTFTLRGGKNEVNYNVQVLPGVTLSVQSVAGGVTTLNIQAQDGFGAIVNQGDLDGDGIIDGGETWTAYDRVSSYNQQWTQGAVKGELRVEASRSNNDVIDFGSLATAAFYVLGSDSSAKVNFQAAGGNPDLALSRFEQLKDGGKNDVYDIRSLGNLLNTLKLIDNAADDHDVIKVGNDAAGDLYNGLKGATEIDLSDLQTVFGGFDWDVLDITGVDLASLTTINGDAAGGTDAAPALTDELVLGKIGNIASVNDFEAVAITQATLAETGTTFVLDTTANTLTGGARVLTFNNNMNGLSFAGTGLEGTVGTGLAPAATSGVAVTVIGGEAVRIFGGDGNDTITTGASSDLLFGGKGADVLDGGVTAAAGATLTITIPGGGTKSGTEAGGGGFDLTNGPDDVFADTAPVGDGQISENADADQIIAHFQTNFTVAEWRTIAGTALGDVAKGNALESVGYDTLANTITFRFDTGAVGQTITAADMDTLEGISAYGNAVFAATYTTTGFAAAIESADTFLYTAADQSTEAATDTIRNFGFVADDAIDISAFGAPGQKDTVVKTTAVADFAAAKTAANAQFVGIGTEVFVVSDGKAGYLFFDANDSNTLDAADLVIKLEGLASVALFDASNIIGETGAVGTIA